MYILVAIVPNCISCISAAAAQCRPAMENKPQLYISYRLFYECVNPLKSVKTEALLNIKGWFFLPQKILLIKVNVSEATYPGSLYLIKESE